MPILPFVQRFDMNEIILISKSPEGDETKEESDVNDSTGDGKNAFDVLMDKGRL